jgi:regulator of replication initiation timing
MNDKDKEILEWREAARSEAEEVNRLQAENKKLREALNKSIEGHRLARMVLREACFDGAADDMTDYIDLTMKALKETKE